MSERITDGYAAKFDHHDDPGGHAGLGFRRSPPTRRTRSAAAHKLTLAALLAFPENAKYRANPGLIHPGDIVRVK